MTTERESARPCGCDYGQSPIHICAWHSDPNLHPVHADIFVDVARTPHVRDTTRKTYPVATGVVDYFPLALMEVARVSHQGNEQHNPGQPLHWAREKSTDQADCLMRHFLQRGTLDTDGMRHSAKVCWRALALLQLELEAEQKRALTQSQQAKQAQEGK